MKSHLYVCDRCRQEQKLSLGAIEPPAGWLAVEAKYNETLSGHFCSPECVIGQLQGWITKRDELFARTER